MPLSRRRFLVASFVALFSQSQRLLAALASPGSADLQALHAAQSRCLQAWIDTLLPADKSSPAASELGVATRVADTAYGNPGTRKLIEAGCRWLDRQAQKRAGKAFAMLDDSDREDMVRLAEQATSDSLPRAFFEYTREHAFLFYYTQPESWDMLNYPGPPQPLGFMDYTRPPAV